MEFMKIATAIIVGIYILLDWLLTISKNFENFTQKDYIKCFIEPFCLIGMVLIAMELWG